MTTQIEADEVSAQTAEQARNWGLFHRFIIGDKGNVYLDRLTLLTTPWFSVKLHKIYRPDQQRDLHDHPWSFLSFVLRGSYVEDTPGGDKKCRWWNFKKAEDSHSIKSVSRSPVWTLVFCGRRRRIWGFQVDGVKRWLPWNEYEKLNDA